MDTARPIAIIHLVIGLKSDISLERFEVHHDTFRVDTIAQPGRGFKSARDKRAVFADAAT
jgi:hypothetical protein